VEELVDIIQTSLDDGKAEDVIAIDLRGRTSIADYMVIATGRSARQVGAMADKLLTELKAVGGAPTAEGMPQCDWVLIDGHDVIVHLFRPEVRAFYNLEKMWGAATTEAAAGEVASMRPPRQSAEIAV
jgi:ribosome-associated protein